MGQAANAVAHDEAHRAGIMVRPYALGAEFALAAQKIVSDDIERLVPRDWRKLLRAFRPDPLQRMEQPVLMMNALGVFYARGRGGLAQDEAEAVRWYRRAADAGDATAQNNLGIMYLDGRGVARDEGAALRWFRRSADQRYAGAEVNLGRLYAAGRGVTRDDAEAVLRRVGPVGEQAEYLARAIGAIEPYLPHNPVATVAARASKDFLEMEPAQP